MKNYLYIVILVLSYNFSGCSGCFGCNDPISDEVQRQIGNITATFPQHSDTLKNVKPTPKPNEVLITDTVRENNKPDVLLIFDVKDSTVAKDVKKANPKAVVTTPEKKQEGKVEIVTPTPTPQQEKSFFDGVTLQGVMIFIGIIVAAGFVSNFFRK